MLDDIAALLFYTGFLIAFLLIGSAVEMVILTIARRRRVSRLPRLTNIDMKDI